MTRSSIAVPFPAPIRFAFAFAFAASLLASGCSTGPAVPDTAAPRVAGADAPASPGVVAPAASLGPPAPAAPPDGDGTVVTGDAPQAADTVGAQPERAADAVPSTPSSADLPRAAAGPRIHHDLPATGIATVYHHRFHGHRTSSGTRYDRHGLSAAHRTLPMGAHVRVVSLQSGRSVIVTINDRGPWIRGRLIDLSSAAAKQLGMHRPGVMRVRIESAHGTSERPRSLH